MKKTILIVSALEDEIKNLSDDFKVTLTGVGLSLIHI